MVLTAKEAIAWVHSRLPFGSRPGLERVKALLDRVNHPEERVPTIHIAGTNGKGSTVTCLRYLLEEQGLNVGTFTSPYIENFNERISINGIGIPDEKLITYVKKYRPLVEELDKNPEVSGITEFETLTAMAFDYFEQEKVDVAIIEVGLGGLLDSTNVAKPMLTGITTIGMDHTDILGDTIEEIAAQKAGIIKANIPVVTGNIVPSAMAVIENKAAEEAAKMYRFGEEYTIAYEHLDATWGELFDFSNEAGKISKVDVSLIGQHQVENAGMAIELFYQYCKLMNLPFQRKMILNGLKKAKWPGRMERISEEPLIILDGAHNTHAMERLVDNVKREFSEYKINILFSAITTKNVEGMIRQLKTIPNVKIYLTTFEYPKAIHLSDYGKMVDDKLTIVSLWQFGLGEMLENMEENELLLITGSLYFISGVRKLLMDVAETQV